MTFFFHLSVHSEYSLMESTVKIKDLISATVRKGMNAVALTDRYVMSGIIEFYEEAIRNNIKPLCGCKVCIDNSGMLSHMIILIRNEKGYENLCRLVSKSHLERKGALPAIKISELQKMSEGLTGITCFKTGEIYSLVKTGRVREALRSVTRYQKIFEDNFFLEIQRYPKTVPPVSSLSEVMVNFAIKYNLSPVATNNVHYLNKKDYRAYRYLFKIKSMGVKNDSLTIPVDNDEHYFKPPSEMAALFNDIPRAISNTCLIAQRCNLKLPIPDISSPSRKISRENRAVRKHLIRLCFKNGLKWRYKNNPSGEARSRLKKELKIIIQRGFCRYFLAAAEIARFARKNNIPICGKGSSAGSIVSYILGISDIDPVRNNLYFERFLNEEREKAPDIDIDISSKRRAEIIKYLTSIYGKTGISRVCTFSTLKPRAAAREAGRVLGCSKEEIDEAVKTLTSAVLNSNSRYSGNSYAGITGHPGTGSTFDREMAEIFEKIKNYPRHISMHPSAFIISADLEGKIPLTLSETGEIVSQYDINSTEKLGLLKIDLISSITLSLIEDVMIMLKSKRNINFNIHQIKYNDRKVFDLIKSGKTTGVFQLESYGIRKLAARIKPSSLDDITHLISLYRPAPKATGMEENFIRRKSGKEEVTCLHKDLEPILKETYGIILYQEQVMKIAVRIAGYSLGEADSLRKAINCLSAEGIKNEKKKFIKGAARKGYSEDTAERIFNLISRFTSYSFVKAHAAAYAGLSYRVSYIKTYYPAELISIILTNNSGYYGRAQYIEEAKRSGIKIKLPHINKSGFEFSVEDRGKSIRIPLLSVRELGRTTVKSILEERAAGGSFKSFPDFFFRISKNFKITEKAIENLIKTGAFDFAEPGRKKLLLHYHYLKNIKTVRSSGHNNLNLPSQQSGYPEDFSMREKLVMEESILGFCASHSPLYYFKNELKKYRIVKSSYFPRCAADKNLIFAAGIVISRKIKKTENGKDTLFCTMEDEDGMYEAVFFADDCRRNLKTIINNTVLIIEGKLSSKEEAVYVAGKNAISPAELEKAKDRNRKDIFKNNLLAKTKSAWLIQ